MEDQHFDNLVRAFASSAIDGFRAVPFVKSTLGTGEGSQTVAAPADSTHPEAYGESTQADLPQRDVNVVEATARRDLAAIDDVARALAAEAPRRWFLQRLAQLVAASLIGVFRPSVVARASGASRDGGSEAMRPVMQVAPCNLLGFETCQSEAEGQFNRCQVTCSPWCPRAGCASLFQSTQCKLCCQNAKCEQ